MLFFYKISILLQISVILLFTKCATSSRKLIAEFWEHTDFQGAKLQLYEGERIHDVTAIWNDRISSIKVYTGGVISIYADYYLNGAELLIYETGQYNLPPEWNDRISSMIDHKTYFQTAAFVLAAGGMTKPDSFYLIIGMNDRIQFLQDYYNDKAVKFLLEAGRSIKACTDDFGVGTCKVYKPSSTNEQIIDLPANEQNIYSSFYGQNDTEIIGTFYEHPNYQGLSLNIYNNDRMHVLSSFNDRISSYKLNKAVTICIDTFHGGACKSISGESQTIEDDFNDRISSIYHEW